MIHLHSRLRASYSTKIYKGAAEDVLNATKHKEAPQIDSNLITIDPKYIKEQEQLSELITLPKEVTNYYETN